MKQVRDIGNTFINNVGISAQETIYIVLQLPIWKSSLNNSKSRILQFLKPMQEINDMEEDSDEVYASDKT